jgi:hypothetical protein
VIFHEPQRDAEGREGKEIKIVSVVSRKGTQGYADPVRHSFSGVGTPSTEGGRLHMCTAKSSTSKRGVAAKEASGNAVLE